MELKRGAHGWVMTSSWWLFLLFLPCKILQLFTVPPMLCPCLACRRLLSATTFVCFSFATNSFCFSIWQIKTWETCKLKLQKLANYNSHDLIQFLLLWFALHELAKMKLCGCLLNFPFQFRWKNSILPRSLKWNKTQVHRHMKNCLGTCCMAILRANACYIFVSICN